MAKITPKKVVQVYEMDTNKKVDAIECTVKGEHWTSTLYLKANQVNQMKVTENLTFELSDAQKERIEKNERQFATSIPANFFDC